ncbi:hypothetical protein GUJ93_ZPchr0010g9912 [Zizania palustris]|uniref:Small ribosomal subunit protein uS7c n=1 Tax=Zizania palustris TaxID=103762 RepID=A0A8J5W7N3_ZIZPA|nr:hypothetical protein GUJ93_ZPchr0010g9912 [Zizania palustris]
MATVGRACGGVDGGGAAVSFFGFISELSASSSLAASFGFFSAFSAPLPLSAAGGAGGGAAISSGFLAAVATSAWRGVVGAALWRGAGGGGRSGRRSKPAPHPRPASNRRHRTHAPSPIAAATAAAMAEVEQQQQEVKLFNRWSFDDVQVNDISLNDYLAVAPMKHATYLPHTAGRYSAKRFRKAQCPIVERLTNSLMMHGRNNGKKIMAVRIVKHAMEIIHLLTDSNPIQIIVDAIINRFPIPINHFCFLIAATATLNCTLVNSFSSTNIYHLSLRYAYYSNCL